MASLALWQSTQTSLAPQAPRNASQETKPSQSLQHGTNRAALRTTARGCCRWVTLPRAFHTTCLIWDFPLSGLSHTGGLIRSSSSYSGPIPKEWLRKMTLESMELAISQLPCRNGRKPLCTQLKRRGGISTEVLTRWLHIFLPQGFLSNMYIKAEAEHILKLISPVCNQWLIRFPAMQRD